MPYLVIQDIVSQKNGRKNQNLRVKFNCKNGLKRGLIQSVRTVEDYLHHLKSKGFQLREDAIGFIYFGQQYTNSADEITNAAIELTLKAQKDFDGSFYISLLEMFAANKIITRKAAFQFVREKELLAI